MVAQWTCLWSGQGQGQRANGIRPKRQQEGMKDLEIPEIQGVEKKPTKAI